MGTGDLTGRPCGRPGGDAVVDDDCTPTTEVEPWPIATVLSSPPFQFDALASFDRVDIEVIEAGRAQNILVLYAYAFLADGSHRELRLEGNPQFPDHDDVERRTQDPRHLEGDGHSAPWQSEHDDLAAPDIGVLHHLGQVATSVHPIAEPHGHLLDVTCSVSPTHGQELEPMVPRAAPGPGGPRQPSEPLFSGGRG